MKKKKGSYGVWDFEGQGMLTFTDRGDDGGEPPRDATESPRDRPGSCKHAATLAVSYTSLRIVFCGQCGSYKRQGSRFWLEPDPMLRSVDQLFRRLKAS